MTKTAALAFGATDAQLHIAGLYYPILLQVAKDKTVITYKELIAKAKALNPNDLIIQKMIPVRSGDVLGVLYHFAESNDLPRITTLVVKQTKGECGSGIVNSHDCPFERERCYKFDWSGEQPKFWEFISSSKAANAAKKIRKIRISMERALDIAWGYYLSNRANLTSEARNSIEKIAKLLCIGISTQEAFAPYAKA